MLHLGQLLTQDCGALKRREVLQVGAASALGLGLPAALRAEAAGQDTGMSVLMIFLRGGVAHLDTWDMKPESVSADARGEFKPIATNVSGIRMCELLPRLAKQANLLTVLNGCSHSEGEHDRAMQWALTGSPATNPTIFPNPGAVLSRFFPGRPPLPSSIHVQVPGIGNPMAPPSPATKPGVGAGFLGAAHQPFVVPDPMKLSETDWLTPGPIGGARLDRRHELLRGLDRMQRDVEAGALHDASYERAFAMVSSPEAKRAFRLDEEPQALRERYGMHEFGQSCLLGRRLIEAGVRYVQVNWSARGWNAITPKDDLFTRSTFDSHFGHFPWLRRQLPRVDDGLPTLLSDLQERGLLKRTLVVVHTEFGRTAKVNGDGGRDHWSRAFTLLMAGGGLEGGRVLGATDETGMEIASGGFTPQHLLNSIYRMCGLNVAVTLREAGIIRDEAEGIPGLI